MSDHGSELYDEEPGETAEDLTEEADTRWLMADPRGRRIMRRLLVRGGVFRTSFTADANTTAFREGERNMALAELARITRYTPDALASVLTDKGV